MNAKFTFRVQPTKKKFLVMFLSMMILSYGIGSIGDWVELKLIYTFLIYCLINPLLGFLMAKFIVFR